MATNCNFGLILLSYKLIRKEIPVIMSSYASLFEKDNKDLYVLFTPVIGVLPDFRPIETLKKMKEGEESSIQDPWQVLYYEVGILASDEREKHRLLVERLLMGPTDDKEEIVTRCREDHPDFFYIYPALSCLIPHVSTCFSNVDRFYLSRGRFDLLYAFRPSFHHLHDVRDEKTFHWLLKDMNLEEWERMMIFMKQEEIIKLALTKKSYGLLLLLQEASGLQIKDMDQVQSLSFSPDLLSALSFSIDWHGFLLEQLDKNTNPITLKLAIKKGYLSPPWFLEDILALPSCLAFVLLPLQRHKIQRFDTFTNLLRFVLEKQPESLEEVMNSIELLSEDINLFRVWNFVYDYSKAKGLLRSDIDKFMKFLIDSKKIPLNQKIFPFDACLTTFSSSSFFYGVDYLLDELEKEDDLCFLTWNHIPSYLFDQNKVLHLLKKNMQTDLKAVFITALKERKEDLIKYFIEEKGFVVDGDILLLWVRSTNNVSEDNLRFIASHIQKEKISEYANHILRILPECVNDPLLFILYEAAGYGELYSKMKKTYSERILHFFALPPLAAKGKLPLPIRIFFAACRNKVLGMHHLLSIDPTTHGTAGLLMAIESKATNVALELLDDERVNPSVRNNEPLLLAMKKANVKVVEAILKNPRFDEKNLIQQLPIEVYDPQKFHYHRTINNMLKEHPSLKNSKKKIIKFLY